MSNLLRIASRVEAAAEAYEAVRGFLDRQDEWRGKFEEEMVSYHLHGVSIIITFELEKCHS